MKKIREVIVVREHSDKKSSNFTDLGTKFLRALTKQQVAEILGALATHIDAPTFEKCIKELSNDIRQTVHQILAIHDVDTPILSNKKLKEKYDGLKKEWKGVLYDIIHDESYIFSYGNPYMSLEDLLTNIEPLARDTCALFHTLYLKGKRPAKTLFDLYAQIDKRLTYLSYGIEIEPVSWDISRRFIQFVLEDEIYRWRILNRQETNILNLLRNLFQRLQKFRILYVNKKLFFDCVRELPEDILREIMHAYQTHPQPDWVKSGLAQPHSIWYRLYYFLLQKYDIDNYISIGMKEIDRNWNIGLELIKTCLEIKAYERARKIVEKMLRQAKAKNRELKDWDIDKELIGTRFHGFHPLKKKLIKLFILGKTLADRMGNRDEREKFLFQYKSLDDPANIENFIQIFQRSSLPEPILSNYIHSWIDYIVQIQSPSSRRAPWIGWVFEYAIFPEQNKHVLQEKILNWLQSLSGKPDQIKKEAISILGFMYEFIQCLSEEQFPFPSFRHLFLKIIHAKLSGASIRAPYWRSIIDDTFAFHVEEFLRENILFFVPDPKDNDSYRYEYEAFWVHAIFEFAPEKAILLIQEWWKKYRRRRKLWNTLHDFGLSKLIHLTTQA